MLHNSCFDNRPYLVNTGVRYQNGFSPFVQLQIEICQSRTLRYPSCRGTRELEVRVGAHVYQILNGVQSVIHNELPGI